MKDLTVVVPAYNEEKNIEQTVSNINKAVKNCQMLVVNDCSRDNTLEVLKKLKKKYKNLSVLSHKKNGGYGAALKTGFANAKTKYVAFLDADLTYHPKYIPPMLLKLKALNLDVVWGNRFGGQINQMPLLRKIGNKMILAFFLLMTRRWIYDCASGERVFTKEALQRINFKTLPNGLDMITAMSKRIIARKLRWAVIPINYPKRAGASKLNVVMDFLRMIRNIIFEE